MITLNKKIYDYDLKSACELVDCKDDLVVDKVLAVVEGENYEADWHWVVKFSNDELGYIRGGCDYTGWD